MPTDFAAASTQKYAREKQVAIDELLWLVAVPLLLAMVMSTWASRSPEFADVVIRMGLS